MVFGKQPHAMYLKELTRSVPGRAPRIALPRTRARRQQSQATPDCSARAPPRPKCCGQRPACRAAWDFLWLFMETSSIHGFSHLTARRRTSGEYIMWITVMILGLVGAISIGMSTWNRYQDNPTVISMERDSRLFNTSFPAATICPTMKYDDTKFKELLQRSNGNKEEVQEFLEVLFNSSYENFVDFRNYSKSSMEFFLRTFPPKNYLDLIFDNRFNFSYAAVNSAEGSLPEVWIHMSEMGICYTYNSEVAMYNDPDYWSGEKSPREPFLILSGNEMDGDLFSQMMDMNSPSIVYIHGPEEIPDCASRSLVLPDLTYKTLDESALALYTTAEARGLSVRQRRCRLRHESDLELGPVYSYNLCRMECRLKQSLRLCSCVPFFYRNRGKYPICDLDGMKCLAAHNHSLVRLTDTLFGGKVDCKCLPTCDAINFVIEMQSDMPWFLGTNLKWSVSRYPQMRLKRDVLFGFTDVLVSIGGTAGLFLGCSILSFIEIIYFFTLRLFWYIVELKRGKS